MYVFLVRSSNLGVGGYVCFSGTFLFKRYKRLTYTVFKELSVHPRAVINSSGYVPMQQLSEILYPHYITLASLMSPCRYPGETNLATLIAPHFSLLRLIETVTVTPLTPSNHCESQSLWPSNHCNSQWKSVKICLCPYPNICQIIQEYMKENAQFMISSSEQPIR